MNTALNQNSCFRYGWWNVFRIPELILPLIFLILLLMFKIILVIPTVTVSIEIVKTELDLLSVQ